jgi:hypothetical protein
VNRRTKIARLSDDFFWTFTLPRCILLSGMKFGSLSRRVTGVSSLNLARRPYGLAGFFLVDWR